SGSTASCNSGTACVIELPGFAWNHGDFQNDITQTWLGLVGPGVRRQGITSNVFSDHADIRPTIMALVGIEDDYDNEGRALFERVDGNAGSRTIRAHRETLLRLAQTYKQINAPLGSLGKQTLKTSTDALSGEDAAYTTLDGDLAKLLSRRDTLMSKMIDMIEDATFDRRAID